MAEFLPEFGGIPAFLDILRKSVDNHHKQVHRKNAYLERCSLSLRGSVGGEAISWDCFASLAMTFFAMSHIITYKIVMSSTFML